MHLSESVENHTVGSELERWSECVCLCVSEYVPKCVYMRVSPPTRGMKFVSVIVL